ncbi:MAG: 2-C-methyl-D-erythritol 4-phosphate cytidylyltransferase [Pseudanabaenaceae cyanobacterium bins.68]|nr:2-C-methyl-D-erythritol 4-phosphate cytidylyltransferase [Pseudanabaenaceae cyanobacterium bins.68]
MRQVPLLIPAAGSGKRMGSDRNKLFLKLADRPILQWTIEAAIACQGISSVTIIGQPYDYPDFVGIQQQYPDIALNWVVGGATRQISVANGLEFLLHTQSAEFVLIHDGARCLVTPQLFQRCVDALQPETGLIAAIPVKDTIKVVLDQRIQSTPDRQHLWAAQTPQGFNLAQLMTAHAIAQQQDWQVTDDAALYEKINLPVAIVPGEETNLKMTTPQDLQIAALILAQRQDQNLGDVI